MGTVVPSFKPQELDTETILTALEANSNPAESSRSALAKLYAHYESRVRYAVGRAIVRAGHRGSAEDVRQEVWCYFARPGRGVLRYYDPNRGSFGPFIQRLAYQRALVVIQHERRRTEHTATTDTFEDDMEDPNTDLVFASFLQSNYCGKLIKLAAKDFDDSDRLLLREVYGNGRSCLAIAKEQNINTNTIYKRHERLKNKLRRWVVQIDPHSSDAHSSSALAAFLALLIINAGVDPEPVDETPPTPSSSEDPDT